MAAVGEKSGRLQYLTQSTADSPGSARHPKLTHICPHPLYVLELHNLSNLWQEPACCQPWMLMQKVSPLLPLMLVNLSAKSHISFSLLEVVVESSHPRSIIAVHMFMQFLQSREKHTRGDRIISCGLSCSIDAQALLRSDAKSKS